MIARVAAALSAAGLSLTAEELAEVLWLVASFRPRSPAGTVASPSPPVPVAASPAELPAIGSVIPLPAAGAPGPEEISRPEVAPPDDSEAETEASLLPRADAASAGGAPMGALPLRVPAAEVLPEVLRLARALRPLRLRRESRTEVELDLDATIRDLADLQCWLPTLRPATERWLELALVVDRGPSMLPWRQTTVEIRRLLERSGAFRNVRLWDLATGDRDKAVLFSGNSGAERSEREMVGNGGERLIVVVTDAVSPAWRQAVPRLLARWMSHQPVALWQMFPAHFWRRTALGAAVRARVSATGVVTPNHRFQRVFAPAPNGWTAPTTPAFPVLVSEPRVLRNWAQFVARGGRFEGPALVFADHSPPGALEEPPVPRGAAERVALFQCNASPTAFRLACLLAAAPLQLPIMRLVQTAMLPGSSQLHLAEVFVGGLLERVTPATSRARPDEIEYAFADGVAEYLLGCSRGAQSLGVLKAVSGYINERFGVALDFHALVRSPRYLGDLPVKVGVRPFAKVAGRVLKMFGGRYALTARALERRVQRAVWLEERQRTAPSASDRRWQGRKILWVGAETIENVRDRDTLERLGGSVRAVEMESQAIEAVRRAPFDAVILSFHSRGDAFSRIYRKLLSEGLGIPPDTTVAATTARTATLPLGGISVSKSLPPMAVVAYLNDPQAEHRPVQEAYKRDLYRQSIFLVTDKFPEVIRELERYFLSRSAGAPLVGGLTFLQSSRLRKALGATGADAFAVRRVLEQPTVENWQPIFRESEDKGEALLVLVSILTQVFLRSNVLFWVTDRDQRHLAACVLREGSPEHNRYPSTTVQETASRRETVFQTLASRGVEPALTPNLRAILAVPMTDPAQDSLAGILSLESTSATEFAEVRIHLWLETLLRALTVSWETLPGVIPEAIEPRANWATVRLQTAGQAIRYSIFRTERLEANEKFPPSNALITDDGVTLYLSELRGLVNTLSGGDARVIGKAFFHNVFPPQAARAFRRLTNIVWEIDPLLEFFPWELLDPASKGRRPPPAVTHGAVRRLLPEIPQPPRRLARTILVLGANENEQKGGAEESAAAISVAGIMDGISSRGYPIQYSPGASRAEIVSLLRSEERLAWHLSGEGYDGGVEGERGMTLPGGANLTAKDVPDSVGVPEFVFVNANRSGTVFAQALLRRGVYAVVCVGLQGVERKNAASFANAFWRNFLAGNSIATSMQAARLLLFRDAPQSLEWAAFQCYGDPRYRLPAPPRSLESYLDFVERSPLVTHRWRDRGHAPIGFLKGMTLVYIRCLYRLERGDHLAEEMCKPIAANSASDALAVLDEDLAQAGLSGAETPGARLRHLFVLLFGLGMRESLGVYQTGHAQDLEYNADTAKAGLFQTSYDSHASHAALPALFGQYRNSGLDCHRKIFAEGSTGDRADPENIGDGAGHEFQELSKTCPAFAVEYAAILLRTGCSHYRLIGRRAVEIVPECDRLLQEAETVARDENLRVLVMGGR